MQLLHQALLDDPHFQRLSSRALVGHMFGETNVISDAKSRGYDDVVQSICVALKVRYADIEPSPDVARLLAQLRDLGPPPYDHDGVGPVGNGVRIGSAKQDGPTVPSEHVPTSEQLARDSDAVALQHFFRDDPRPLPPQPAVRVRVDSLLPWAPPAPAPAPTCAAPSLYQSTQGGDRCRFDDTATVTEFRG